MKRDQIGKRPDRQLGFAGKLTHAVMITKRIGWAVLVLTNGVFFPNAVLGDKGGRGVIELVPGSMAVEVSVDEITTSNRIQFKNWTGLIEERWSKPGLSTLFYKPSNIVEPSRSKPFVGGR